MLYLNLYSKRTLHMQTDCRVIGEKLYRDMAGLTGYECDALWKADLDCFVI